MMNIKRILGAVHHRITIVLLKGYFLIKELKKNKVYVQYSVFGKNLTLNNRNFGDDINRILVENLFNKTVIPFKFSLIGNALNKDKFMCIGSVITMFDLSNTIVWGTGVLSSQFSLIGKPKKVYAVRGPLTRQCLIERGIDCPEVYGDPALLLPRIYSPTVEKKYRLGIIAHYLDHKDLRLQNLIERYKSDVLFIDVVNYGKWKEFINKILSCEFIISSSLHGLIISDAYEVPNYWCQIKFEMDDDGFKFRDYFLSVKRNVIKPYIIKHDTTIEELEALKSSWTPIDINIDNLVKNCPFI